MTFFSHCVCLLIVLLLGFFTSAQKSYETIKISKEIVVDGDINESVWLLANIADSFVTKKPVFGELSKYATKIRILYDDNALYVSGEMHDLQPDSVNYMLSQRDDYGNSDWFRITIDPYGNAITSMSFGVTSTGVEIDGLEGTSGGPGHGDLDKSWNAVWRSAASKTDYGWSFEMKIPYSALRFPNKEVQEWKFNMYREVRRIRESSTWTPVNPLEFGTITQSGTLTGISDIKPPLRLSFTPYVTGYIENFDNQGWGKRITGGMDLKYGINDAFTLDMTLIPDFGQTTSDNQVLNLGPFEVRYNENRPFFLEGLDLFSIGDLFYSRRIGGLPYNYSNLSLNDSIGETVSSNPDTPPLYNATKISGRTKKGLGIGFFNATEGRSEAIIVDSVGNERIYETNPFTNYNVLVLAQNLKNNGVAALVNTNVTRVGDSRDANVTAAGVGLYSKDGMYSIGGEVKLSTIIDDGVEYGHNVGVVAGKVAGTWQYELFYGEMSDTYDPNDLAFLLNNNRRDFNFELSWNDYTPSKYYFSRKVELSIKHQELYKPRAYTSTSMEVELGGLHKRQIYTTFSADVFPFGYVSHFESRTFGKEVIFNPSTKARFFFSSDYSKKVALDGSFSLREFIGVNQRQASIWLGPRFRLSNRLNLRLENSFARDIGDYGYVFTQDDSYADDIILGLRERSTVVNSIKAEYIFTKRIGLDLRLRHYWSQVEYRGFMKLLDEGITTSTDYFPLSESGESSHNTSYNAFTVDLNFRWIFIPGSELRILYKNNLFHSANVLDPTYFSTFEDLFQQPQLNSVSLKLLVFVDALYFRRKK